LEWRRGCSSWDHLGKGFDAVFDQLITNMKTILEATPKDSTFLIENSAGQEGKLCPTFVDIQRVFDALPSYVKAKRLGWCFDTCHGFAAGYDLKAVSQHMKKFDLLDALQVIHLNDSRNPYESGRDRHDNIGEGLIGKEMIKTFLHDPTFEKLPLIMEVPGFDGNGPDAKNIEIVKAML
jgi:deoxyribonuclease-4